MKYKCYDCGEIFDEEDADVRSECVGEFWGAPAYMDYNVCPRCGSQDIEETHDKLDEEGENE